MQIVQTEISEEAIRLLEKQGYLLTRIASLDGAGDYGVAVGFGPGRGMKRGRRDQIRGDAAEGMKAIPLAVSVRAS